VGGDQYKPTIRTLIKKQEKTVKRGVTLRKIKRGKNAKKHVPRAARLKGGEKFTQIRGIIAKTNGLPMTTESEVCKEGKGKCADTIKGTT